MILMYNLHVQQFHNPAMMWCIIFILMEFVFGGSLEVGDICSASEECGQFMECHNKRCTCKLDHEMIPVFTSFKIQSGVKCAEKEKCDYGSYNSYLRNACSPRFCRLEPGKSHAFCVCLEGTMQVKNTISEDSCWIYKKKDFNAVCDEGSPMCDVMKGLVCRFGRCLCKADQMYDFKQRECISQLPFLDRYGITKYQGHWGDYCVFDEDCFDILECAYNKSCECPYYCDGYIKEHDSCHCGDHEFPTGPVLVGIFVGLFIVFFWCYQINKLCEKYKKNRTLEPEQEVPMTRDEGTGEAGEDRQTDTAAHDPPQYDTINTSDNMVVPTAPPLYMTDEDPPPAYEDVVKMDLKDSAASVEAMDIKKAPMADELQTKLKGN